jgi:hypothetical protein
LEGRYSSIMSGHGFVIFCFSWYVLSLGEMFLVLSVCFLYKEESALFPHIGHDSVTMGIRRKGLWNLWAVSCTGASARVRKLCSCMHECETAYNNSVYDRIPEWLRDSVHCLLEEICATDLFNESGKWATRSWPTAPRSSYKREVPHFPPCIFLLSYQWFHILKKTRSMLRKIELSNMYTISSRINRKMGTSKQDCTT